MAPTNEILQSLRDQLARRPGGVLEQVAEEHGVSLRTVIDCLPEAMRSTGPGDRFCEVMADVAGWGPVTLIVHTSDGIFEFAGPLPEGTLGRGFYNVPAREGFGGHLRADRCHSIVFLRRPFMGKHTASLQFLNEAGGAMFKIFVGRDESGELRSDQLSRFDALERRISPPRPA
jgi:putative heme utilization carrier protein HutX